ncbi:MAG: GIY-YIG nuclease family protein [Candidatus Staskawiczbacteria bacterium]|nr:GIY-YIG nuclease family protein [Candidatus Staskawiczbacteria bacterium]
MYYVYILKSEKDGQNYIGFTSDLEKRLEWHNVGKNVSTKHRRPFKIIYFQEFSDKKTAMKYESWIKKQKGGIKIKELIRNFTN